MYVVLQEVWPSLSGISLRRWEEITLDVSPVLILIQKWYLAPFLSTPRQTTCKTNDSISLKNTKVMWCWLFLACHLRVDKRGPSTTFQNSVIVSTWKPITWFLWHSVSLVVCKHVVYLTPPLVTYACHLLEVHCWHQIKRGAAPVIFFLGQTKIYHKQRYASPGNVIGEFHVISEKQT